MIGLCLSFSFNSSCNEMIRERISSFSLVLHFFSFSFSYSSNIININMVSKPRISEFSLSFFFLISLIWLTKQIKLSSNPHKFSLSFFDWLAKFSNQSSLCIIIFSDSISFLFFIRVCYLVLISYNGDTNSRSCDLYRSYCWNLFVTLQIIQVCFLYQLLLMELILVLRNELWQLHLLKPNCTLLMEV